MAKTLSALRKRRSRDIESLNKKQALPAGHKVGDARSKKAKLKKAYRA